MKKKVIIIGAGPAGLTAAYKLMKESNDYNVTIIEQSDFIGGISRTVACENNRMDVGGHRFFSKDNEVMDFIFEIMPVQGEQSIDDIISGNIKQLPDNGIDPNKVDCVLLKRNRYSRIVYNNKLYDYPITITFGLFKKMGYFSSIKAVFSYLKTVILKRKVKSLEDFYINRFGKYLYKMFFEGYTEKLWGVHPSLIDPSWGVQRVKGLSLFKTITNYIDKKFNKKNRVVETSLIEEFYYPKFGIGQFYVTLADKIIDMGGTIIKNSKVVRVNMKKNVITNLEYINNDNKKIPMDCDILISSMPIKDLISCLKVRDKKINSISSSLPYRGFVIVGLLVDKINLVNNTNYKTVSNILPDHWLYIQDYRLLMGRVQIFNNWSPYIVNNFKDKILLGVEYFCDQYDNFWNMSDEEKFELAKQELIKANIIDKDVKVVNHNVLMESKAYPAYHGSYSEIKIVKEFLFNVENLYCVGRNGQHRYNNMDHSISTSLETVKCILNKTSKKEVWSVNTESKYNE